MKKRMKLLGLLLAGGIALGSTDVIYVQGAQNQAGGAPVAGVAEVFAEMIAENDVQAIANRLVEETKAQRTRMAEEATVAEAVAIQEATEAEASVHEVPVVASEYADIAIAQVNNYVNVRLEPNTESEILGKLYNNSAATVLEVTEDGWYRIHSGNVEGYVKAEYVVVGDEELARSVSTRYATVTTTTLFVRSEPTTEASILTMLPEGDDLVVQDESTEGWVKVSTVEGDGYVSTDYVILSTEYIHAESKAEEEERLAREEAERQAAARAAEEARLARAEEEARLAREEAARRAAQSSASSGGGSSSSSGSGSGGSASSGSGSASTGNTSSSNGSSSSGNASSSSSGSTSSNSNSSSSGSTSSDSSTGGGSSSDSSMGNSVSNGQAVVNYAMQFLGNPYVYGGTSLTNGADCSGFVQSVYAAFGVKLPRNSTAQRSAGYAVSLANIQPGDIVCYSGHVGIYAGNNTLIHASNERTGITLTSPVTYRTVLAVRRIF